MPLTGDFTFVLIPADESQPITEQRASKAGGLTDDALVQYAKNYFHEITGSKARAEQLENASPQDKKAIAAQIRQQLSGTPDTAERLATLDDATVVDMIYKSQVAPSCDISALTIPMSSNNHTAVSMYCADNARQHGLSVNKRATALMTACGHQPVDGGVFGDAFVGRALDNEETDIWERTDFTIADADPAAEWCRIARNYGGGGGSGRAAAASLSNLVQQHQLSGSGGQEKMQVIDGSSMSSQQQQTTPDTSYGMNGVAPVHETWGTWTQTDDEVELKFAVPTGTKSKYCKVVFSRTSLKVSLTGQVLLQGTTFDPVVTDECTYTLQDEGPSGRELCVTLSKAEPGRVWAFVAK